MITNYKNSKELNIKTPIEVNTLDRLNYTFKVYENDKELFVLSNNGEVYLLGDTNLSAMASLAIAYQNLEIKKTESKKLQEEYVKIMGGTFTNNIYQEGSIKRCLFAGGCFWCMAHPYYTLNGVIKVLSGYAGGNVINPTYEQTKKGKTGHKETVLIIYDESKINYETLLDTFFSSIDPFDPDGQFIDKGSNYQTGVFTNDVYEINVFKNYKGKLEDAFEKEVMVKLLSNTIFYIAEEKHQDYAIKNPLLYEEEYKTSGRDKFEFYKVK